MKTSLFPAALLVASALGGCGGLAPYTESPDTVIATAADTGRDSIALKNGFAAIAYDPDGCQNWIIDDGVEGYSSPVYDPVSKLPICNNQFPPGAVVKNYQTPDAGLRDWVPGSRAQQ